LTKFTDLGLDQALLKALATEGYTTPTPIQAEAIPGVMAGRDLLGIAQTGTGKTAAFALPILHRLAARRRPATRERCRVLVLAPTRELASQIAESFRSYGRHLGFSVAVVFGGVPHRPQTQALERGVDILVATPGRLLDHMGEGNIALSAVETLVLDEADQMLDLGFLVPIRRIVRHLPQRRQSLFFSATMPSEIGKLAGELLTDPLKVSVAPAATTVERVSQRVILVERSRKVAMLAELFSDPAMSRTLVFTRTKRGADRVARRLEMLGVKVAAIHGNKSQRQREAALAGFKASRIRALVATDIAARGIDVDQVTHVVNFELPNMPESYVHRIGRTARAGAEGIAISLCDGEEQAYLRDIERLTRQRIPATDRRNDANLASDAPAGRSPRPRQRDRRQEERGPRRGHGPQRGDDRRQLNGAHAQHGRQPHGTTGSRPRQPVRYGEHPAPERRPAQSRRSASDRSHSAGAAAHHHGRDQQPDHRHRDGDTRRTGERAKAHAYATGASGRNRHAPEGQRRPADGPRR
jgi:ATP-dependent RNA helicase RhlE